MSLQIIDWDDMQKGLSEEGESTESAMTIGVFDGVHKGHLELIKRVVRKGPNPTIVTFRDNPKKVVSHAFYEGDIFSLKQKIVVFEQLGIRRVILIDFSLNFSKLAGREFFRLLAEQGKMVFLAVGSNFRCGYQKDTDADHIKEMNKARGIPTEVIEPVSEADGPVSSSRIKSAIISGDMKKAAVLMGRNMELDLSDLKPAEYRRDDSESNDLVFDLKTVHRIFPANGKYPVIINPGAVSGQVLTENGKVFLPGNVNRADSLEFI